MRASCKTAPFSIPWKGEYSTAQSRLRRVRKKGVQRWRQHRHEGKKWRDAPAGTFPCLVGDDARQNTGGRRTTRGFFPPKTTATLTVLLVLLVLLSFHSKRRVVILRVRRHGCVCASALLSATAGLSLSTGARTSQSRRRSLRIYPRLPTRFYTPCTPACAGVV